MMRSRKAAEADAGKPSSSPPECTRMWTCVSLSLSLSLYIYIYIERERDVTCVLHIVYTHTAMYVYMCVYIHMFWFQHGVSVWKRLINIDYVF